MEEGSGVSLNELHLAKWFWHLFQVSSVLSYGRGFL